MEVESYRVVRTGLASAQNGIRGSNILSRREDGDSSRHAAMHFGLYVALYAWAVSLPKT